MAISKSTASRAKKALKKVQELELPTGYKCTACGRVYDKQYQVFYRSTSPFFAGNDGYISICRNCIDKIYGQLVDFFNGDSNRAIERLCQMFDLYYSESLVESVRSTTSARFPSYIGKLNIPAAAGKTYNDSILDRQIVVSGVTNAEEVAINNDIQDIKVTQRDIELFGYGWKAEQYKMMRTHHRELRSGKGDLNPYEETMLHDLCTIRVRMNEALMADDTNDFTKLSNLYQTTYDKFNERFQKEQQASQNGASDPVGTLIENIEEFTPAEYYKDKKLFADADGIGEYCKRFIFRPLKNLLTGTKEMDAEYSVSGDDDG